MGLNCKNVTSSATDKNGQVKVSTNRLAPVKIYKATITFAGNAKYDKSTKLSMLKLLKQLQTNCQSKNTQKQ